MNSTIPFLERLARHARPYCGDELAPGINEVADWSDWTNRETTPDQLRIENFLESVSLKGKTVLHVGMGNSSLARRFAARAEKCVAVSIMKNEVEFGRSLGIANYVPLQLNKFSAEFSEVQIKADVIVDNNPGSYACCYRHFTRMLDAYSDLLGPGGVILSDKAGLQFVSSANKSPDVWRMNVHDWAGVASSLGLSTFTPDENITVSFRSGSWIFDQLGRPRNLLLDAQRSR